MATAPPEFDLPDSQGTAPRPRGLRRPDRGLPSEADLFPLRCGACPGEPADRHEVDSALSRATTPRSRRPGLPTHRNRLFPAPSPSAGRICVGTVDGCRGLRAQPRKETRERSREVPADAGRRGTAGRVEQAVVRGARRERGGLMATGRPVLRRRPLRASKSDPRSPGIGAASDDAKSSARRAPARAFRNRTRAEGTRSPPGGPAELPGAVPRCPPPSRPGESADTAPPPPRRRRPSPTRPATTRTTSRFGAMGAAPPTRGQLREGADPGTARVSSRRSGCCSWRRSLRGGRSSPGRG